MRHAFHAFCAVLLALAMAGAMPEPSQAGGYRSHRHADKIVTTRRYVRDPVRIKTRIRYVDDTRVVKRTRLIRENRVIVHVQPVIKRDVIVHRQNTVIRNVTLRKVKTVHRVKREYRHEVVNRYVRGRVRVVNEYRTIRGHHRKRLSYRD